MKKEGRRRGRKEVGKYWEKRGRGKKEGKGRRRKTEY